MVWHAFCVGFSVFFFLLLYSIFVLVSYGCFEIPSNGNLPCHSTCWEGLAMPLLCKSSWGVQKASSQVATTGNNQIIWYYMCLNCAITCLFESLHRIHSSDRTASIGTTALFSRGDSKSIQLECSQQRCFQYPRGAFWMLYTKETNDTLGCCFIFFVCVWPSVRRPWLQIRQLRLKDPSNCLVVALENKVSWAW